MENFLRSKEYWYVVKSGIYITTKDVDLSDEQKKGWHIKD